MFQDSAVAQKMKCGPTKLSHIITFRVAPYFKKLLLAELQEATCFIVSYDESVNEELQQEEMDFIVKCFKEDKVACRYLASTFL